MKSIEEVLRHLYDREDELLAEKRDERCSPEQNHNINMMLNEVRRTIEFIQGC